MQETKQKSGNSAKLKVVFRRPIQKTLYCSCYIWKQKNFYLGFKSHERSFWTLNTGNFSFDEPVVVDTPVHEIYCSRDIKNLILLIHNNIIGIYSLSSKNFVNKIKLSAGNIFTFCLSGDDKGAYLIPADQSLHYVDFMTQKIEAMSTQGLEDQGRGSLILSNNQNLLIGSSQNNNIGYVSLFKNLKFRFCNTKKSSYKFWCNELDLDGKILFSGNGTGKVYCNDLRSSKLNKVIQIHGHRLIARLRKGKNIILGGVVSGSFFVIEDSFPFALRYFQNTFSEVQDVNLSDQYLFATGEKSKSICLYENTFRKHKKE